jgi:hypothetical protein
MQIVYYMVCEVVVLVSRFDTKHARSKYRMSIFLRTFILATGPAVESVLTGFLFMQTVDIGMYISVGFSAAHCFSDISCWNVVFRLLLLAHKHARAHTHTHTHTHTHCLSECWHCIIVWINFKLHLFVCDSVPCGECCFHDWYKFALLIHIFVFCL